MSTSNSYIIQEQPMGCTALWINSTLTWFNVIVSSLILSQVKVITIGKTEFPISNSNGRCSWRCWKKLLLSLLLLLLLLWMSHDNTSTGMTRSFFLFNKLKTVECCHVINPGFRIDFLTWNVNSAFLHEIWRWRLPLILIFEKHIIQFN